MNNSSEEKLITCDFRIQRLFNMVDGEIPLIIICGHRGEIPQNKAFKEKRSKLQFPKGEHNGFPSLAIDVAPLPLDWNDNRPFYYLGGYVKALAKSIGIPIRWGGDWDGDHNFKDQTFNDLVHYELLEGYAS